jgi:hypothetical protein
MNNPNHDDVCRNLIDDSENKIMEERERCRWVGRGIMASKVSYTGRRKVSTGLKEQI